MTELGNAGSQQLAASSHAATCDKKQIAICFTDFHAFAFICTTETFINIKQKLKLKQ